MSDPVLGMLEVCIAGQVRLGQLQKKYQGGGTEPAGEYTFFYVKGNENHELGKGIFVHKRIISAVNRVEFFNDRMSLHNTKWSLV
jgi:hypothetical protein